MEKKTHENARTSPGSNYIVYVRSSATDGPAANIISVFSDTGIYENTYVITTITYVYIYINLIYVQISPFSVADRTFCMFYFQLGIRINIPRWIASARAYVYTGNAVVLRYCGTRGFFKFCSRGKRLIRPRYGPSYESYFRRPLFLSFFIRACTPHAYILSAGISRSNSSSAICHRTARTILGTVQTSTILTKVSVGSRAKIPALVYHFAYPNFVYV